jgi:hypothetical protein
MMIKSTNLQINLVLRKEEGLGTQQIIVLRENEMIVCLVGIEKRSLILIRSKICFPMIMSLSPFKVTGDLHDR